MPWGIQRQRRQAARPLLPPGTHRPAALLVAGCVVVTACLALAFGHQARADRLDAAVDARIQGALGSYQGPLHLLDPAGRPVLGGGADGRAGAGLPGDAPVARSRAGGPGRARGGGADRVRPQAPRRAEHPWLPQLPQRARHRHVRARGHLRGAARQPAAPAAAPRACGCCWWRVPCSSRPRCPSPWLALGFHYFTDIVAGAAVGTGTVLLIALLIDLARPAAQAPHGMAAEDTAALSAGRLP